MFIGKYQSTDVAVLCLTCHTSGFYNAYLSVRPFIHEVLRIELKKNPTTVYFTGHSLGGALATLAAFDVSLNTIPRVNAYLKHQEK